MLEKYTNRMPKKSKGRSKNKQIQIPQLPRVPSAIHRGIIPEYNYMIDTLLNNSSSFNDQLMVDVSNEEDPQDNSNDKQSQDIARGSPINAIRSLKKN